MAERGARGGRPIGSWEDLRAQVNAIVERINEDRALALGAAANPLLALEELGYEIDPGALSEIEDRLRFRPPEAKRLGQLRRDLHRQAGGPFDPASDREVRGVLSDLGVAVGRLPAAKPRALFQAVAPTPVRGRRKDAAEARDVFAPLRGKHAIVEPLLEYRQLEAAEPRFATRNVYRALREGRRKVPIRRLNAVVKPDREG